MSDMLSTLAAQTGIDIASIEKMVGAVLKFLRSELAPETYAKVEADKVVEEAPEERSGGLMDMATKLASKFMGKDGEASADLMGNLLKTGVSMSAVAAFLPQLFQFLAAHLPPEIMSQLKNALPALPGIDLEKALHPQAQENEPGTPETTEGAEVAADSPPSPLGHDSPLAQSRKS
jgi:hypothetical protein